MGAHEGPELDVDASIGTTSGYYPVLDMRSLKKGEAAGNLLGWSFNGGIGLGAGGHLSANGSVGINYDGLNTSLGWISSGISVGIGEGIGATGGLSYSTPVFKSQFK
ncbi:hypothetical protein [Pedobacter sp. MC2016-24]|uniref:hypothetical protein n=1 Tax=Pedobacter sp. MC2016-24 TaxID=2780090 RepID=UPI00187F38C8|nr:hypothetical protein [Pedobacter sp. MC2016-24]MBE9601124.1 hypothetical protein [Pedobacter sp. MC2016-24]